MPRLLALTQGDPAGIGPEVIVKALTAPGSGARWIPVLVVEWAALEPLRDTLPGAPWDRLQRIDELPAPGAIPSGAIPVLDPVRERRTVTPGRPGVADAGGACAALDLGIELARRGVVDALVTGPVSKARIARHVDPGFRGHTDYLAAACGLERYGRDYLMAFIGAELRVALLSTHLPLREALDTVRHQHLVEALRCLARCVPGSIGVAGLNPHAGEEGLLGTEELDEIGPAVRAAAAEGIPASGPESADTIFARARRGAFDWVMSLYHDQGLIAVKTAGFGTAVNRTLGLPFVRTSVDHGTAFGIAGRGIADDRPLRAVLEATLRSVDEAPPGEALPRGGSGKEPAKAR